MSQGIRPPEAQLRQRIAHTKTHLRKHEEKSHIKSLDYLQKIESLEAAHKALTTEGSK